jgi:hypothetical protein
MDGSEELHAELDRLQRRLPKWGRDAVHHARKPGAVWLRCPLAIALMIGGLLGFLPVLGLWMLPLGLALLAIDLPFLRGPLTRLLAYINRKIEPRAG